VRAQLGQDGTEPTYIGRTGVVDMIVDGSPLYWADRHRPTREAGSDLGDIGQVSGRGSVASYDSDSHRLINGYRQSQTDRTCQRTTANDDNDRRISRQPEPSLRICCAASDV
jgi:hypothetical protein